MASLVGETVRETDGWRAGDSCQILTQDAKIWFATASLEGSIAINFYTLLSEKVAADSTAYMQFTMADGEVIQIPISEAISGDVDGETYYMFTCEVNAKEMTDNVACQLFYEGGSSNEVTYNVKDYGNYIINNYNDASAKDLDEDVTITINDDTTTVDMSFNSMSYCQDIMNDKSGSFSAEKKNLVIALYLYNRAANEYFSKG